MPFNCMAAVVVKRSNAFALVPFVPLFSLLIVAAGLVPESLYSAAPGQ
jgi:hypothetical protein